MSRRNRPRLGGATGERGAVTVLVAIITPLMILLLSFVIDLGNAFEHHRHLQLQADAAALAGAQEFASSCTDANVVGRAFEYSGISQANLSSNTNWTGAVTNFGDTGAPFNAQVGGTTASNIYEAINSQNYLPSGNTAPSDSTSFTGSPCGDSMIDVKMTETKLPWYFQVGNLNYMNAHARATWSAIGSGFLPLAVDEQTPVAVEAYFVDESNGNILAQTPLTNSKTTVGSGPYASDSIWTSPVGASAVSLPVNASDIGVILALSGDPTTTACNAPNGLVTCYNRNTGSGGDDLVHIHGYSNPPSGSGSVTSPVYESVTLSDPASGGCASAGGASDTAGAAYFSVTGATTGSCNINIIAQVALGSGALTNVHVKASFNSNGNQATNLTLANGVWSGLLQVANSSGANPIYLEVCSGNGNSTCTTPVKVQTSFAANDNAPNGSSTNSGTIDEVELQEQTLSGGTYTYSTQANSFPKCDQYTASCAHQIVVTADIGGSLADASKVNDPVFSLNFGQGNTASQTGTIECPPNSNSGFVLGTTLLNGCAGNFAINYSPTTNSFSDPNCTNTNPSPGPADCVQAKNGGANGQVDSNLYCRFVGGTACVTSTDPTGAPTGGKWYCPSPNSTSPTSGGNWASFDPNNPPYYGIPRDDSRLVELFITPYNSYSGTGSNGRIVPIQDVGVFYVMGWNANGQNVDPCGNSAAGTGDYASEPPGAPRVWGHFIHYTTAGQPSPIPCKNSGLGACSIALTQ